MYSLLELAVSLGVLLTLVYALSACVCGCKNSNQKSELVGTAGVVTIRFDEEAPSPTPTTPASIKRATSQNNQRSLPEIPHPVGRHDSGDTASDTYATVNLDEANKIIPLSSASRIHDYEQTIYAIPQKEHRPPEVVITDQVPNGDIPIDERDASQMGPDSVVISASVAISGQLASSHELPYITPPPAQHFSGDSTDSAKGYTSISVRPPLSNIRAAMLLNKPQQAGVYVSVSDDSDDMYAHIEGQSGSETYAQIAPYDARRSLDTPRPAPSDVIRRSAPPEMGTSSNTTHSRQASSSSVTPCALGSPKPEKRQANSPLPPPPAGPPPTVPPPAPPAATPPRPPTHSLTQRQQRIASTGDLHFNHDKVRRSLNEKHQRNNSCVSSSDGLQTFYGCNYPVEKHRFSSGDLIRPLVAKELKFDIDTQDGPSAPADPKPSSNTEQRITESPSRNVEEMYAKVIKKMKTIEDSPKPVKEQTKYRDDPGYETIDRKTSHGYETIPHKELKVSHNQDPGYETVKDVNKPDLSLTNNNMMNKLTDSGPNSIISSDPGYEHIAKNENSASDSDPNYEVLRTQPSTPPYATITPNYKLPPTYSIVNKKASKHDWTSNNNVEAVLEPNYESMPNDTLYNTGSESDPNYESVRPKNPNYESVDPQDPNYESIRRKDPKYESVRSKDPNYESVKYLEVGKKEPPYEKVIGALQSTDSAGYEKIAVPNKDSKTSISGESGTVSDYFQV